MPKLNYFQGKLSQGFVAIYSGRMILRISVGMLGLFMPIFMYELFNFNINYVIIYYVISFFIYPTTVAWGCKYLNKIGLRKSLRISVFGGALYYLVFYIIENVKGGGWESDQKMMILFLLALVFVVHDIFRILYWTPLHTDIAKFTDKKNRAKELSALEASTYIMGTIMPLIAGWILLKYGYNILFIIAIFIYMVTLIPFMFLPRTEERFSWGYIQSWKEFFSKKRRKTVFAFLGTGAEDVIGAVIWPIFIWELLHGNYFSVGVLSSLTVGVTVIMQLLVGKYSDIKNKNKMIKLGTILYSTGWIFKIFLATAFQIFVASTYHNFTKIFAKTPFDALTYEKAADQGHYVDEFTVIHEMAINYGKVISLILILVLLQFVGLHWTFIIAALASLAMNFLVDEETVKKGRFT